ncbi:MAG: class I adenylate-forming enzyme family protein, partial [Xanthobacteraceae bacterium]|nr:class I adenylate-forming enzyme family protein [Xanthobacteraceae bacterium]
MAGGCRRAEGLAMKPGELAIHVSLDALFRRNAQARPDALALADPVDRMSFTDGAPLRLSYSEADVAIDRLARRLQSFGLGDGAVVAIQLPNIVEAVIALLAVLRAGLIAAPVPVLWRRSDLVAVLGPLEVKALLTTTRLGNARPAEAVCEAAVDLFSLSFPCAFGADAPDGVISLDLAAAGPEMSTDFLPVSSAASSAVAIATFDAAPRGFYAVGRSHAEWIASGLAGLLEARIGAGDSIVSTLPPASLAGIGAGLVPWLLSGGALELVYGYLPVLAPAKNIRTHLLAPAAALPEIERR